MIRILNEKGFADPLKAYIRSNRPFLGICLGLQALLEASEEAPDVPGLGFIGGTVRRFPPGDLSVPHIGWNGIRVHKPSGLLSGLEGNEKFYFVHSYYVDPDDREAVLTTTDYGECFTSGIQLGNITAFQFHPEKSGDPGELILKNFLRP